MAQREGNQDGSIVQRVLRLPLLHSAYQIMVFAYQDVKNLHPALEVVCNVSERGVKALGGAAVLGASPVLKLVEPQMAVVNNVAVRVVDQLEERLPVLNQAADEVVSDVRNKLVSGVSEVRARVMGRVQGTMNRTQTLVRGVYEATSLGVLSLGTLGVRELVRLGVEIAVNRAEDLVDVYLPEEEEDGAQGLEGSGSEDTDEEEEAGSGLVSRFSSLVGVVYTRSFKRLNSNLDLVWTFLHGGVNLLFGMPTQVMRFSDAVMEALNMQNISKEDPKQKVTPKKSQVESSLLLRRAPNRRRSPQTGASVYRAFTNDKQVLNKIDRARAGGRERRRQSLDSSFFPSEIQED
ncbi:perilipin-2-like [Hyla sarda]|uniref:perilipin-2-like n=1 Tax=Hyla sarda TaxID=327740 RepID=UPI0024C45BC6|nr:perilipin-2-like [Hyla sarda]